MRRRVAFSPLLYCLPGAAALVFAACALSLPRRPCTDSGELARPGDRTRVTKQCYQRKDRNGNWVNDGPYIEWHKNGKRALKGEYRMGLRHDKWEEWDDTGKLLSEKHFMNGKEVPRFETPSKSVAPVAPTPSPAASSHP